MSNPSVPSILMPALAGLLAALAFAAPRAEAETAPAAKGLTMQQVLDASNADDWRVPDPENTL